MTNEANCKEMSKLKNYLDNKEIEYECCDSTDEIQIARVHFTYKGIEWSCIHGHGTYGGWTSFREDKGLLELWAKNTDEEPIGYLTYSEVVAIIEGENHD